jgi:hypothetical protein
MDAERYSELVVKRDDVGLTDEEADELGRMIAEREGADYENADTLSAEREAEAKQTERP